MAELSSQIKIGEIKTVISLWNCRNWVVKLWQCGSLCKKLRAFAKSMKWRVGLKVVISLLSSIYRLCVERFKSLCLSSSYCAIKIRLIYRTSCKPLISSCLCRLLCWWERKKKRKSFFLQCQTFSGKFYFFKNVCEEILSEWSLWSQKFVTSKKT